MNERPTLPAHMLLRPIIELPHCRRRDLIVYAEVLIQEGMNALSLPVESREMVEDFQAIFSHRASLSMHGVKRREDIDGLSDMGIDFVSVNTYDRTIASYLVDAGMSCAMSALTPTEIWDLWRNAPISAVMIDPPMVFGSAYPAKIARSFPDIPLIPRHVNTAYDVKAWREYMSAAIVGDLFVGAYSSGRDLTALRLRCRKMAAQFPISTPQG